MGVILITASPTLSLRLRFLWVALITVIGMAGPRIPGPAGGRT